MGDIWDVIIVGGGVLGLSTAYQLTKRNISTLLLEQFNLPHTRGSSNGGSRVIRSAYADHRYSALIPEAQAEWKSIADQTGIELYRKSGLLLVQSEPRTYLDSSVKTMQRDKMPHEVLTGSELEKRYSSLKYNNTYKILIDPSAGVLRANKCMAALQKLIISQGGRICEESKVIEITPGNVITVRTINGATYRTKKIILTAGPWANELLAKVNLQLPIKTLPAFQCFWKLKPGMSYTAGPDAPGILHWIELSNGAYQFFYVLPQWEYPGMMKVALRIEPDSEYLGPEQRDATGPGELIPLLQDYIREHLPFLEDKPCIIEPGIYALTDNKDYIIDRHPKHENILIGAGLSAHGFKTAPVLGRILSEMVTGVTPSYDVSAFTMKHYKYVSDSNL